MLKPLRILSLLLFFFSPITFATLNPLPVNEVFQLKETIVDPNTLQLNFKILPNHYLYQKRLHFKLEEGQLGPIRYPKTETFKDSSGKEYQVYDHQLSLNLPLLFDNKGDTTLVVSYQGCSANGFCYPPQKQSYQLFVDQNFGLYQVKAVASNGMEPPIKTKPYSLTWLILGSFFLGLLLAFTPCVLPMIPIISALIVGQKEKPNKTKAFFLSGLYVTSMSVTYALIGLVIALTGKNLQIILQSPVIIISFSALFVLLSLSLFGYFDLKLPEKWTSKLSTISQKQNKGKGAYLSAIIMGSLATLILTPCVSAPLAGLLSFIAQSGSLALGFIGLLFLGLGMGSPLLIIGLGAQSILPKTGPWMNEVKTFFAILMLGLAVYTLSKLLPTSFSFYLYGALLIAYGFKFAPFMKKGISHPLLKAFGFVSILYGSLLIIGGSMGNNSFLNPLKSNHYKDVLPIDPIQINSLMTLNDKLVESSKPVMVYFSANWCTSCHILKKSILQNPNTAPLIKQFTYLEIDLTHSTNALDQLMDYYHVIAPPTFLFFSNQKELKSSRIIGEVNETEFKNTLQKVLRRVGNPA